MLISKKYLVLVLLVVALVMVVSAPTNGAVLSEQKIANLTTQYDPSEDDDDIATGGDVTDPDEVNMSDINNDFVDGNADEDEASSTAGGDESSEVSSE